MRLVSETHRKRITLRSLISEVGNWGKDTDLLVECMSTDKCKKYETSFHAVIHCLKVMNSNITKPKSSLFVDFYKRFLFVFFSDNFYFFILERMVSVPSNLEFHSKEKNADAVMKTT